ncbi:MAG: hypothetical protein NC350_02125 [Corallococcus sp.]|nr:hypothetical protein [Corallococcus sp.]
MKNDNLDYFICYCGKDMPENSATRQFADILYDKLTGCGKRVYFAPRMGQGDAYNSNDNLQKMISGITTSFIVLLTPRFFDDFDEQTEDRESPVKKEMVFALSEAKRRGAKERDGIKNFVKYVHSGGFVWQRSQKFLVRQLFADYALSDYFDVGAFVCPSCTAEDEAGNEIVDKRLVEAQTGLFIKKHLDIDVERENSISEYRRDVDLCFHTIVTHAQQFFLDDFFAYADASKHTEPKVSQNYAYYNDVLKRYGLYSGIMSDTRTTSWQVFFTDTAKFDKTDDADTRCAKLRRFQSGDSLGKYGSFSTCAVCFGALHLFNRITSDKYGAAEDFTREYFNECLRGAVNLIMFMQNEHGSWPEQKRLGQSDSFEADNGLNQTTIAVSTLLKVGFLQANKLLGNATEQVLAGRFKALNKAINWLLDGASRYEDGGMAYWNIDGKQEGSTLMTAMCLDTFIKWLADDYVKSHMSEERNFDALFVKIIAFFARMQNADGGLRPEFSNEQSSFSHTAKVMNTLCTLWSFTKDVDCKEAAEDVINKCLAYLAASVGQNGRLIDENNQQDFEFFNIPDCEDYEMSGEMLLITAVTKILKMPDRLLGRLLNHENYSVYKDGVAREQLTNRLVELMNAYRKNHVVRFTDITATETLMIQGKRQDPSQKYPVYLLYYYNMALTELLDAFACSDASADDKKEKLSA